MRKNKQREIQPGEDRVGFGDGSNAVRLILPVLPEQSQAHREKEQEVRRTRCGEVLEEEEEVGRE
jgi:hypothetical protein